MNTPARLAPVVEVEEDVYSYEPADNGAAPTWCFGSTCLVRIGDDVFASGLETLKGVPRLNNVRWTLYKRGRDGWALQQVDEKDRTREPCPLACFPGGPLFMSVNPTLVTDRTKEGGGPARPEILEFSPADTKAPFKTILPIWDGKPAFTEHSYRTFAADGASGELVLFQNIGTSHSEWAFRDREGRWIAKGKLLWPKRENPKHAPYNSTRARANYPNVVLRNRAVHFCGGSAFNKWARVQDKPELMGRKWGSRWRRLHYTWTPDVTKQPFAKWLVLASTEATGGWLFPGDMWVGPDGTAHVVWSEHPIHGKLREEHFPDIQRTWAYKYAQVRDGKVIVRRTLMEGGEGASSELPGGMGFPRLQITPDGRRFLFYYVHGKDAAGKKLSENRLMELLADGTTGKPVRVPLEHPFTACFTATPRGGSAPSSTLDILGTRTGARHTISYACVQLW